MCIGPNSVTDLASAVHLHPNTEEEDHILQTTFPTGPHQSLWLLIYMLVRKIIKSIIAQKYISTGAGLFETVMILLIKLKTMQRRPTILIWKCNFNSCTYSSSTLHVKQVGHYFALFPVLSLQVHNWSLSTPLYPGCFSRDSPRLHNFNACIPEHGSFGLRLN